MTWIIPLSVAFFLSLRLEFAAIRFDNFTMILFRKAFSFLVLLLIAGVVVAQVPSFQSAVEYNDYIVEQQLAVGKEMNSFNEAMSNSELGLEEVKVYHLALLNRARISVLNISKLPGYQGNVRLRNGAKALYEFYVSIIDNEYRTMMEIVMKAEPTEDDIAKLGTILEEVTAREKVLDAEYLSAQKEFAEIHGFTLEPAEGEETED